MNKKYVLLYKKIMRLYMTIIIKKHICQLQLMRQIESDKKIIKTQIKMNYK